MRGILATVGFGSRLALLVAGILSAAGRAEGPLVRYGDPVPRDVREIYDAGIRYLLKTQDASGAWKDGQAGPGVTGMAMMVLLGSGEDPNHGPYRAAIRKALRSMIADQDPDTGFLAACTSSDSRCWPWRRPMVPWTTARCGPRPKGCGVRGSVGRSVRRWNWPSAVRSPRPKRIPSADGGIRPMLVTPTPRSPGPC